MQIKTTMRSMSIHPLECLKSVTLKTPSAGEDVEHQELSFIPGGNTKRFSHFGRQFGCFFQN